MKILQGFPNRKFDSLIIGTVTKSKKPFFDRKDYVLITQSASNAGIMYSAVLSSSSGKYRGIMVQDIPQDDLITLNEGDIIGIEPSGIIRVLWDVESKHNCCLLTEACNCRCIMCPQPPKKDDEELHKQNIRVLSLVNPDKVEQVCFTGGEPTLFPERLVELMSLSKKRFKNAHYDVLTNGITFSDFDTAKKIALATPPNTTFCVSLHADVADIHEKLNGVKGSFPMVIKGIHNLAKMHQAIEIRPVITKKNFSRLKSMANYIYRNFPFTVHVAFMGMEIEGYAKDNYSEIWIDPKDYASEVSSAAWELHRYRMNVSIYNIPLCLLPKESWMFARKSISDWKNNYLDDCKCCAVRDECCGIFTTSGEFQSNYLRPVDNE